MNKLNFFYYGQEYYIVTDNTFIYWNIERHHKTAIGIIDMIIINKNIYMKYPPSIPIGDFICQELENTGFVIHRITPSYIIQDLLKEIVTIDFSLYKRVATFKELFDLR